MVEALEMNEALMKYFQEDDADEEDEQLIGGDTKFWALTGQYLPSRVALEFGRSEVDCLVAVASLLIPLLPDRCGLFVVKPVIAHHIRVGPAFNCQLRTEIDQIDLQICSDRLIDDLSLPWSLSKKPLFY